MTRISMDDWVQNGETEDDQTPFIPSKLTEAEKLRFLERYCKEKKIKKWSVRYETITDSLRWKIAIFVDPHSSKEEDRYAAFCEFARRHWGDLEVPITVPVGIFEPEEDSSK